MVKALNGIIILNRGDSGQFEVSLIDPNTKKPLSLADTDSVYFGLMDPGQPFEYALLRKKYTAADVKDNEVCIAFTPEDTLDLLPGKYWYAVKLRQRRVLEGKGIQEYVVTLIPNTKFIISQ